MRLVSFAWLCQNFNADSLSELVNILGQFINHRCRVLLIKNFENHLSKLLIYQCAPSPKLIGNSFKEFSRSLALGIKSYLINVWISLRVG